MLVTDTFETLYEIVNPDDNSQTVAVQRNQYKTIRMIDYGSFGDVLKVRSKAGKVYAMKQIVFRGQLRNDPYIISEVMCLSELKHENIIRMHEILVKDGEIDIIMDYAEQESLEKYYSSHGIPTDSLVDSIYDQILQGVSYCHSMNIAHRDLTPSNVLLTIDNVVKIADFGLAVRCFDDEGRPILCSDYLGNVAYSAPEVLARQPFLAKTADIWSLGVVLLFMIYFDIPFKGFETCVVQQQQSNVWREFHKSHADPSKSDARRDSLLEKTLVVESNTRADICEIVRLWSLDANTIHEVNGNA